MYSLGCEEEFVRDRIARARAAAEEERLARLAAGARPTPRARVARKLFEVAVVLEPEEAWRAVWEKLEAPRRTRKFSGSSNESGTVMISSSGTLAP